MKMNPIFCSYLALLLHSSICVVSSVEPVRLPSCVYYHSSATRFSVLQGDEEPYAELSSVTDDHGRQVNITTCRKSTDFCYTFWKDDGENHTSPTIISQGCWESSSQVDCNRSECLSTSKSSKLFLQSRFCCCSGDLCNLRVSTSSLLDTEFIDVAVQTHDSLSQTVPSPSSQTTPVEVVVIVIISVAIVVGLIVTAVFIFQTCIRTKLIKTSAVSLRNSAENQSQPLIEGSWLDSLKLVEVIGQGRYGTVWKASMGDNFVAVKVFNNAARCYYYNEREVYSLPFLEHPNVVKYFGCEEVSSLDGHIEYRLILEHAPFGCLQEYLRQNSVDWSTLCKMGRSIARGLAHLHTDFPRGDRMKLCIAHRDLNSRNVLVKADLTCCLCDLGFAMQISGSHYYYNGEEQHAETTSLCDVGTLRYMSPEVLEGAVNLRECESSLKQIDVYSLGLVLWEIAYRCHDLYPTKEAPQYLLPFEEETGPHPTLEQMKTLVCRHKTRPILPDSWRDSSTSVRLLKATLEDAWDQDAEARLTSLCVEERWAELPVLWERERHKGFSPTLHTNPCNVSHHVDQEQGHLPSHLHHPVTTHPRGKLDSSTQKDGSPFSLGHGCSGSTTIEAAAGTHLKNSVGAWPPSPRPLQPHQGRNPCMERNTCIQSEEFSVSGNALVDRSAKHLRMEMTTSARLESVSADGPSSSSSYLNYSRVVNPIPYVQNAVREAGSARTSPGGPASSEESIHGIGKFLSGIFRLNRTKRNSPASTDADDWEEHQRLCPTLSSPSDVENPQSIVVKTNNQSVTPKATQVRWEEQGLPSVSLVKPPNTSIAFETTQATACSAAFNESALESDAKAEAGVGKLQAPPNAYHSAYSPKGMRRQETKSTAISGCDKTGEIDTMSSEFSKPKSLSTHVAPTNP